ncbi:WD repeat and HMG-box DNA-binding protein 1-like [Patiria miniata]|uniref:HMG box domain-containing protein n=1 Tax=Patiria miniata TaxID=46514 RepID=A0A913YXP0_PATMI|nr:WD repeat and HMG-box DNA-binding protein 1-like [Patiria miniata]XP_038044138.1 WD repeat and HMG-box DNA-binding protein 1-like [Patiria miniata]
MPLNKQEMRMGHSEGQTDVCYEETGNHILTCGSDGDVRIWKSMDDDDPESINVGDAAYAIAMKNNRLYTASEANTIQAHTFPEGSADGIVTRFTAPVTHFCLSEDGEKLLAGASDFTLKYVDIEGSNQKSFHGHNAPVLSVAIDPKHEYIASSSCDGTLKIWSIADQSWEKSVSLIPKCSDVSLSKTLCRLSWKPQVGKFLAVPVEKEIHIYERDSWDLAFTLTPQDVTGFISVTAWSPCGHFMASANTDGHICIWDVNTRECIDRTKHNKGLAICGMAWHPANGNEIAYTDVMGQVGVLDNVIPPDRKTTTQVQVFKQSADLFDDDAVDEDFLDAVTQAEVENAAGKPTNEGEDGDDVMPATQHKRIMQIQDDDNSMDGSSRAGDDGASVMSGTMDTMVPQPTTYEGPKPTPLQKPFIPAATPVHLASRFMKWNSIGIIRCYDTEDESSIDVEFHDTSVHHAMHFDNQLNRTMADLSAEAVLLGSETNGDVPSQLVCYHFASWDNQKEWTTSLPKGENIKCLTLGRGWLAVATDKRLVRLFSIGGMQREILAIPGPVVCLAGHGNQLIIVYHAGTGVPGEQCLGVQLLHIGGKRKRCVVSGDRLPVSPKATLAWLGFSAEGTPCTVDSEGVVRLLNRSLLSWIQISNTKNHSKSRSDHFWVVGLNESPQQLRCIQCKGAAFPPTLPRPSIMVLPFQVPLCDLDTEKGIMEEAYWRADALSKHIEYGASQGYEIDEMSQAQTDREKQENIMKLFALACRTDREYRASEICQLMTSQHAVTLAIKYASRSRRMALAERLNQLAQQMMEEEMAAMETEQEEEEHDGYYSNATTTKRSSSSTEWSTLSRSKAPTHQASRQDDEDDNEEAQEEEVAMEDDECDDDDDGMPEMKSRKVPTILIKPKKDGVITSALPSSQTRKNPFKRSSSESQVASKGSSVFDSMKKLTKLKAKSPPEKPSEPKQKKGKTQSTLFGNMKSPRQKEKDESNKEGTEQTMPVNKPPSAFSYWLTENQASLAEETPELSESDLIKLATQKWRSLPAEEKKDWGAKAKRSVQSLEADTDPKENAAQETTELTEGKKRKLPHDGEVTQGSEKRVKGQIKVKGQDSSIVKRPLLSSTNSKLAGFAFKKD